MTRIAAAVLVVVGAWPSPVRAQDKPPEEKRKEPTAEERKREEDEHREKVKKFYEDYKAKDAGSRAAAVDILCGIDHQEAYSILEGLLTADTDEIRIKAAQCLKKIKNPRTAPVMIQAIAHPNNKGKGKVQGAIAEALAEFEDPGLADFFIRLVEGEDEPAKEAVQWLGRMKVGASIEKLLHEWGNIRNYTYTVRSRGRGRSTRVNAALKRRHDLLAGPIDAALGKITGENHGSYGAWEEWWKKKKAGR